MKKLMMAVAAMAAMGVQMAFAGVPARAFYWTGAAGTGSWSTPGNWKLNNVACTDTYPGQVGDDAYFDVSADVTLDTGAATPVTRIWAHKSGVVVRVYGTTGSSFVFSVNMTGSSGHTYAGLNAVAGSKIYLYADATTTHRYDPTSWGDTYYCGKFTNNKYNNFLTGSSFIYSTGCDYSTTYEMDYSWGMDSGTVNIRVEDDAKLSVTSNVSFSEGKAKANVVQDGEDTYWYVKNSMMLGGDGDAAHTPCGLSTYLMKSGTLDVGDLYVGHNRGATFTQEGGYVKLRSNLHFGNNGACQEPCVYNLKAGTLETLRFTYGGANPSGLYQFNQSGGLFKYTLAYGKNYDKPYVQFNYSGTCTNEISNGEKLFQYMLAPTFATNTVFVKKGNAQLNTTTPVEASDCTWHIQEGTMLLNNDVVPLAGNLKPLKIRVTDSGALKLASRNNAAGLSMIYSPFELEVEGNGQFGFNVSERYGMYIRSITTNGVKLAKGLYGYVGGKLHFNTDSYATILIPYVWTGKGDGHSWSDAQNWEDETVPPSANTTCVDLSAATVVDMPSDKDYTIHGFCYCPAKADGVLRINSEKKLSISVSGSYIFSSQVRRGCKAELNAKWLSIDYEAMLDGGTYAVVRSNPSSIPTGSEICGTVLFDGVKYSNTSLSIRYQGLLGDAGSTMIFDGGTELTLNQISMGYKGTYSNWGLIQHKDAKVTLDTLYITRATTGGIYPRYQLLDGELTVSTVLGMGHDSQGTTYYNQYFEMTGGKLTVKKMTTSNAWSYFYLYGGDIYLGDGGIDCYRYNCGTSARNTSPGLQLGGVKIHATADFSVAETYMDGTFLTTEINGTGGSTVIDTDTHTVTWHRQVSGAGTLVKEGTGNLVFTGTNVFTGTLVVKQGNVSFTGDGTNDMNVAKVVLASTDNLTLGEGQTLTTGLLVVDGEAQAAGEYDFGNGKVTVTASEANYFIGASGSMWSVGENWSQGAKPADGSAVDFSNLSGAFEIELDEDVSLGNVTYAGYGTDPSLTFTGAGKASFPASATIAVTRGQSVTFENDVVIGGAVTVTGGTANFAVVSNAAATATLSSTYTLTASGSGAGLGFSGEVSGVTITASATSTGSKATDADIVKVTINEGAVVPFGTAPFVNLVDVIQNGGTVTFSSDSTVSNGARVRYFLNGGTLDVGDATLKMAGTGSPFELHANGGTVKCAPAVEKSPFDLRATVALDGTLAFEQDTAARNVLLASVFTGEGTIEQKGLGTLVLDAAIGSTNLVVSGGTLKLTQAAAAAIPETATVSYATGAELNLDYEGTVTVRALYKGTRQLRKGVYGEDVAPGLKAPIVGDGFLSVLEGNPRGIILIFR